MHSSKELQNLAQISSEVDQSAVKLTYANQCIKAQETLANKLKEEIQRRKEICYLKKSENLKLEEEIRNAEFEIENSRIAHKTIQLANTEVKKELLLTKEEKSELQERIKNGEKKYEELWLQCKTRYENIPLVKKLTQDKNKCVELKNNITVLENETKTLENAIELKKNIIAEKNQKQIIQLADFFVNEVPAAVKTIKDKTSMVNNITKELKDIAKDQEAIKRKTKEEVFAKTSSLQGKSSSENSLSIDDSPMMPKLHLPSADMDVINFKLDINKVTLQSSPVKRTISFPEIDNNIKKKCKPDENIKDNYISCYFSKNATVDDEGNSPINYEKKKLIHIIEDVQIDDVEAYKLMTQANVDQFQNVDVINASKKAREFIKSAKTMEIEEIKDADIPNSNDTEIIGPPSQFLDSTQSKEMERMQEEIEDVVQSEREASQVQKFSQSKETNKKKVSFDLPNQDCVPKTPVEIALSVEHEERPNESEIGQFNYSEVTDNNCMALKDMILKKNQLDLSPQFVYAKNTMLKRNNDKIITSKFFDTTNNIVIENNGSTADSQNGQNKEKLAMEQVDIAEKDTEDEYRATESDLVSMDVGENVSSPKASGTDIPVSGLLFTHGPQGIPDLDISMSTTGYEEGDSDFPTCFDSSLLLSPKADLPLPTSGNSETYSQDLPSFLSGYRKAGISYFKQQCADANADSNEQNQENNYNFKFGSDEKKTKGGIFSFFH